MDDEFMAVFFTIIGIFFLTFVGVFFAISAEDDSEQNFLSDCSTIGGTVVGDMCIKNDRVVFDR